MRATSIPSEKRRLLSDCSSVLRRKLGVFVFRKVSIRFVVVGFVAVVGINLSSRASWAFNELRAPLWPLPPPRCAARRLRRSCPTRNFRVSVESFAACVRAAPPAPPQQQQQQREANELCNETGCARFRAARRRSSPRKRVANCWAAV